VLVNTNRYYDFLLQFLNHAVKEEFVRSSNLALVQVARDSAEALQLIQQHRDKTPLDKTVVTQNAVGLKP
jgi:predicted Rossmann-fold nucleotide-binding protein